MDKTASKYTFIDPEPIMRKVPWLKAACFDGSIPYGKKWSNPDNQYHCRGIRNQVFNYMNKKVIFDNDDLKEFRQNDKIFGEFWRLQFHVRHLFSDLSNDEYIGIFNDLLEKMNS